MKKIISKPHPNIFVWIEREESVTKAKIQSYRTGATSRQRRRRVKEKEKRIQALFDRFNAGNISLEEYLGAIKHQSKFVQVDLLSLLCILHKFYELIL